MRDLKNVTFETNTTQKLHKDFVDYPNDQDRFEITGVGLEHCRKHFGRCYIVRCC